MAGRSGSNRDLVTVNPVAPFSPTEAAAAAATLVGVHDDICIRYHQARLAVI